MIVDISYESVDIGYVVQCPRFMYIEALKLALQLKCAHGRSQASLWFYVGPTKPPPYITASISIFETGTS